jgi:hypothetical protein
MTEGMSSLHSFRRLWRIRVYFYGWSHYHPWGFCGRPFGSSPRREYLFCLDLPHFRVLAWRPL